VAVERIVNRCNQPFQFDGRALPIGASIGVSIYPDDGTEPDLLLDRADQAIYAVNRTKKSSR
jgi:GGDEF domain-containing protein